MGTNASTPGQFVIQPGDVLANKYVVERTLGVGGMGIVVAARHLAVKHRVALKLLLPGAMSGRVAAQRFLREAQAAAAIRNEHVVRVTDLGTLDTGAPYLVMEYLEGMDLARLLIQRGALPPAEAVGYVLQALVAIAEAHTLSIVHRDLKPSNIFLTERSDGGTLVKVLDFGISKAADTATPQSYENLTRSGTMIGSPAYMAPEQIRSSRQVDGRADIWSLGIILHELVTGRPPFMAEEVSGVLAAIVADEPAQPRALQPGIPRGLEHVVLKCLEKDPKNRYASARELAEALEPFGPPEASTLVRRITAITQRSGRSGRSDEPFEARLVAVPRARPTRRAWAGPLASRSGGNVRRMVLAVTLVAAIAGVVAALRARDVPRSSAHAVERSRQKAEPPAVAGARSLGAFDATSLPGVIDPVSASHGASAVSVVASAAPTTAPSPMVKKRGRPSSTPTESTASGKSPRSTSDIVLDRR